MNPQDLKNRVFGAGHRIMTGIGVVAGALVALGQYLDYIPPEYRTTKWYAVAAALAALGAALKLPGKADAVKAALWLALALPATIALAQDPAPAPAPTTGILSLKLGANWSTHANVAVGAVGYSFTQKAWLASVPITGLYAFCYAPAKDSCAALGGSFAVGDDSKPRGSVDVALLSPAVVNPFQPSGSGGVRVGLDGRFTFGPVHEQALLFILPFQF